MRKVFVILLIIASLMLSACMQPEQSTTATTSTLAETTAAETSAEPSETTAATTTATAAETTAEPTTVATETTVPTTTGDGTQVLTGKFESAEWGDYLHINIKSDDGKSYSFFVLRYPGIEVETLAVGQKLKIYWKNSDEYLDPPGETQNIDVAVKIELMD